MNKVKTTKVIWNIVKYISAIVIWFDLVALLVVSFITGGEAVRGNDQLLHTLQWLTLIGIFIAVMRIAKIIFDLWIDELVEKRVMKYGK